MTEILDLLDKELTRTEFQPDHYALQDEENILKLFDVLFPRLGEDDDNVEVDNTRVPQEGRQQDVRLPLKGGQWTFFKTKGIRLNPNSSE